MKTSHDPRHLKREQKVQSLFAYAYQPKSKARIKDIIDNIEQIDKLIQASAPEWPLDKINRVDLAILRLATYEIIFDDTIPSKVSIDEAVEIAKKYGAESSPSFVNGVLGTILEKKDNDK